MEPRRPTTVSLRLEFRAKDHIIAALFRWKKFTPELLNWVTGHGDFRYVLL